MLWKASPLWREFVRTFRPRVERRNGGLFWRSGLKARDRGAMQARLAWIQERLPDSIRKRAALLERELERFDSFDVIAHFWMVNLLIINPDTYKETEAEGCPAFPEYLALLSLKRPYQRGEEVLVDGPTTERVQALLHTIFRETQVLTLLSSLASSGSTTAPDMNRLRHIVCAEELLVRNPAYELHLYEVLRGIFDPFKKELRDSVGFDCDDALALAAASRRTFNNALHSRGNEARLWIERIEAAVHDLRATGHSSDDDAKVNELARELSGMSDKEIESRLLHSMTGWTFLGFGQTCSYSVEDLSKAAGVSVAATTAYLSRLSLKFGDVAEDFSLPTQDHPLRRKPYIEHNGRFLAPSYILVDWAIQPALEGHLKNIGGRVWERYHGHRHDYVLARSVQALKTAMPACQAEMHLDYELTSGSAHGVCELDALVKYDSAAFLLEVKGAPLSWPSRRGAPQRFARDMKRLLGQTHVQAIRAREYVEQTVEPIFLSRRNRRAVVLDKKGVTDIFAISVTLEPIGHLSALVKAEEELGISDRAGQSWMVSLYDLLVITDLLDIPATFTHYLKRRLRISKQAFLEAHDELDFFGYYLKRGLYFDGKSDIAPADFFRLTSQTTEIDSYYFYKMGMSRTPAEKPTQAMPVAFRTLLESLGRSRVRHTLDAALFLLDWDEETREAISRLVADARSRHDKDGRKHDSSLGFQESSCGFTYMCGGLPCELPRRLGSYCILKKHQTKSVKWVGVGEYADGDSTKCAVVFLDEPWSPNSRLDRLVQEAFHGLKQGTEGRNGVKSENPGDTVNDSQGASRN